MRPPRPLPALALAIVVWPLTGCLIGTHPAMALVRVHAEKDLECASKFLEVEPEIGGRYVAKGCGRTATYDTVCDGLQCQVTRAGEEAPAWRGRPDPGSFDDRSR
ncbi:MAG: hypothetical protein KC731_31230 [Myxococcales bacterium]|nr:hypothetical protein [Myxococcales bacterium]